MGLPTPPITACRLASILFSFLRIKNWKVFVTTDHAGVRTDDPMCVGPAYPQLWTGPATAEAEERAARHGGGGATVSPGGGDGVELGVGGLSREGAAAAISDRRRRSGAMTVRRCGGVPGGRWEVSESEIEAT
jgi:hypothetical protein